MAPDPDNPDTTVVWGSISTLPGHPIEAGLVTVEACAQQCVPVAAVAANDVVGIDTEKITWVPGPDHYQVVASWVDDAQRAHHGVAFCGH